MPLKFGDSDCTFMFGDKVVSKIYFGDDLVFENYQPVSGETWVINEHPSVAAATYSVPFTSNSTEFVKMIFSENHGEFALRYETSAGVGEWVCDYDVSGWLDDAYRTVTFETAPTGELLAWLQANAVKQVPSSGFTVTLHDLGSNEYTNYYRVNDGEQQVWTGRDTVLTDVTKLEIYASTGDVTYYDINGSGYPGWNNLGYERWTDITADLVDNCIVGLWFDD